MAKMVFVEDRYINLDHVKTLKFSSHQGKDYVQVAFADGDSASFNDHRLRETHVSADVIPAPSGFKLAVVRESQGRAVAVDEEPIIAFRIPQSGEVPGPITLHGEAGIAFMNKWAIIRPDGVITDPYDREFGSIEEYLTHLNAPRG